MNNIPLRAQKGWIEGWTETVFTILLLLFAIVFIWGSTQISDPPRNIAVGPRTFPLMIGGIMLPISIVLVWQQMHAIIPRLFSSSSALKMLATAEQDDAKISDWPSVWGVLGSLLALILLLEHLGFILAIAFFLFGVSTFFSSRRWLLNLIIAIVFSIGFNYLFVHVLGIPLPSGVLNFLPL